MAVAQLKVGPATGIHPAVDQGFTIIDIGRGRHQFEVRRTQWRDFRPASRNHYACLNDRVAGKIGHILDGQAGVASINRAINREHYRFAILLHGDVCHGCTGYGVVCQRVRSLCHNVTSGRIGSRSVVADVLQIYTTHRYIRAAVAHDEPTGTRACLSWRSLDVQQLAVPPEVVAATARLVRHSKGVKRVGVVTFIQDLLTEVLRVVGVDLQNATLLAIGTPDNQTVAIIASKAHTNLCGPRTAGGSTLLPNRVVVVVLQPAVVGG